MKSTNLIGILLFMLIIHIIGTFCSDDTDPPGHLQRLGSHRPPEENIEETIEFPDPEFFFKFYVQPGKPLLIKGAAKKTPAFRLWSDNYFRSKYGEVQIFAENNKKENRDGFGQMLTFEEFLLEYNHSNMYLVTDIPHEMYEEVLVPKSVLCGGFQYMLFRKVIWFSSGGTKSVLHFDELDNINCLLDGTKQLVLINKNNTDKILFDHLDGGFSSVDVEKVDMYKYDFLQNVSWHNVSMEAGDCLFIPYKSAHQVVSSNTRNLAVNLWFIHLRRFNLTDCKIQPALPNWLPLASLPIIPDLALIGKRDHLFRMVESDWPLSLEKLSPIFIEYFKTVEDAEKVFIELDTNKDELLSIDEVLNCDLKKLAQLFDFLFDIISDDTEGSENMEDDILAPSENIYGPNQHSEF